MGAARSIERYRFGAFELQPDKRRLLKDGATISLRPRAFDLLAALVDRAGHLVTKDELLDQVWPKVVVEEAALHVQVSALRKVLGADAITTVSGRGYQLTLPVTRSDAEANHASKPKHNLPYQLTSFVGREQEIVQLNGLVTTNRLVPPTGSGRLLCPVRATTSRQTPCLPMKPCACLSTARDCCVPISASRPRMPRRWLRSAAGSTGSPWPSSLRHPACARCRSRS